MYVYMCALFPEISMNMTTQYATITSDGRCILPRCIMDNIGISNTGWWYTYPSETYEFVSWDDDIPN